ncbi:MAG: aminotransferase class I/II-fold pyridoxal phosphate-dependent enzyme [Acidimicrobiia bacterium]
MRERSERAAPRPEPGWDGWMAGELDAIRAQRRWRSTRCLDALGPVGDLDGQHVVSFASNDYLGLSAHPSVIAAAQEALGRWGTGATASRLVVGERPVHGRLEADLAEWKGAERAVVFPSGYAANLGVVTALAGPGTTVLSDELNHASIVDACRLSRAEVGVYRHLDLDHLADRMAMARGRVLVVTDSVFSMDGDVAPLDGLVALCRDRGALLVVDEAHAVLGPHLEPGTPGVVQVGTLSKTLGSLGGWVAGEGPLVDLLVNRARTFIFTTGLSPADAAAARAALRILRSAEGDALLARLRAVVDRVRPGNPSPIVPVVLGDEDVALKASAALLDAGLLVPAIRPPTVPPGTSRLRVALSAAHDEAMVDQLTTALAALGLWP